MEPLNEDIDLENLMDDLRDLGLGESKVYLKVSKGLYDGNGGFNKELSDYIRIDFPRLDIRGIEINDYVIIRELRLQRYNISFLTDSVISPKSLIERNIHTRIGRALNNSKIDIQHFMERLIADYSSNTEVVLYINGKLEHKEFKII